MKQVFERPFSKNEIQENEIPLLSDKYKTNQIRAGSMDFVKSLIDQKKKESRIVLNDLNN